MTTVAAGTDETPSDIKHWRLTYTVTIGALDGPVWRGKNISDVIAADTMEQAMQRLADTHNEALQLKFEQPGHTTFEKVERIERDRYEQEVWIAEEARKPSPKYDLRLNNSTCVEDALDYEHRRTQLRIEQMIKDGEKMRDDFIRRRFPPQDLAS